MVRCPKCLKGKLYGPTSPFRFWWCDICRVWISFKDKRGASQQLVEGPNGKPMTRKAFLKLPIEVRRKVMSDSVNKMFAGMTDEQRIKEMHDMMD